MLRTLTLILVVSLSSCIQKKNTNNTVQKTESQSFEKIDLKYSKGFQVDYFEGGKHLKIVHPKTLEVLDEMLLITTDSAEIPKEYSRLKQFRLPIYKFASQSTTHVSFLDKIDQLQGLLGVSYAEYVKNEHAQSLIESGKIENLTLGSALNVEKLLDLNPELIFMYPFDQQVVEQVKSHIPFVLTTEYLEDNPLAKAEWLKFFALFFNEETKANMEFKAIEDAYLSQIDNQQNRPIYFLNVPFQNTWNCPPGNSFTVSLLKDAGLTYQFENEKSEGNLMKSFEEILDKCIDLEYWVIFAIRPKGFTLRDLIKENSDYSNFKAVQTINVIFCNTSEADYFGDALVEPHLLLKDLKAILNKTQDSTEYFYRLQ